MNTNRTTRHLVLAVGAALLMAALFAAAAFAVDTTSFQMVRSESAIAKNYLKGASANVDIRTVGGNQIMDVEVKNAAKNTGFTLFAIQQPNDPFGVSWYQGDIDTNNKGYGKVRVIGIFSEETFAFSPVKVKAPQVDDQDAENGPKFAPVHTLHLGMWFADPKEAKDAGCSGTVTPFDGDHEAGIQALSTRNFPDLQGPLGKIK